MECITCPWYCSAFHVQYLCSCLQYYHQVDIALIPSSEETGVEDLSDMFKVTQQVSCGADTWTCIYLARKSMPDTYFIHCLPAMFIIFFLNSTWRKKNPEVFLVKDSFDKTHATGSSLTFNICDTVCRAKRNAKTWD